MKSVSLLATAIAFLITAGAGASDLIEVLPVTDRMLVAHFKDGHIIYHGKGEKAANNVMLKSPLDTAAACEVSRWTISSTDDPTFAAGLNPVATGRKSKGTDFNHLWDGDDQHFVSSHWVYLELPQPLSPGKSYTIALPGLADNCGQFVLQYDLAATRSPAVHVNQVGYRPDAPKFAYLSQWMGDFNNGPHQLGALSLDRHAGAKFHLVRVSDGKPVFSGQITRRHDKSTPEVDQADFRTGNWAGSISRTDVWEADFSTFNEPGEYVVSVEGMGCSYPFVIHRDAYRPAWHTLMRGLFIQRATVDKELAPGRVYPRDHHYAEGLGPKLDGKIVKLWGWYHDAGDWDGYARHVAVPQALLALYDLNPAAFKDGDVGNRWRLSADEPWIEEAGNGVPDLLDEAMWLIRFYRLSRTAMQDAGVGTGGVTDGQIGPDATDLSTPSWEDRREFGMSRESTVKTLQYAGLAAELARCLERAGRPAAEVSDWRDEALSAWEWASKRADLGKSAVGTVYGAAALYRLTGEDRFQRAFKEAWNQNDPNGDYWMYPTQRQFASYVYASLPADQAGLDTAFHTQVRQWLISAADRHWVEPAKDRAFRLAFDRNRFHHMGLWSTPRVMTLAFAHRLTGEKKYQDPIFAWAHYILGGNEMNLAWITGVGHNPVRNVFHVDSWSLNHTKSPAYDNPILPGLVPYATTHTGDGMGKPGANWDWQGDEDFSRSSAYPHIDQWPPSETRFDNRWSIIGGEFTIEDNLTQATFALGCLLAESDGAFRPATPPEVTLELQQGQSLAANDKLTARTGDDVARVAYFADWHHIGFSTDRASGFAVPFNPATLKLAPGSKVKITAMAWTSRGLRSEWSPAAERDITCAP